MKIDERLKVALKGRFIMCFRYPTTIDSRECFIKLSEIKSIQHFEAVKEFSDADGSEIFCLFNTYKDFQYLTIFYPEELLELINKDHEYSQKGKIDEK